MKKLLKNLSRQLILAAMLLSCGCCLANNPPKQLRVFQLNIWQEGTIVPGGYEGIIEEIVDKDPDVVLLSEVRNYQGNDLVQRLLASLKVRGLTFYAESSPASLDVAVLAKYPIEEQKPLYRPEEQIGAVLKTKIKVHGKPFLFYAVHLDYKDYACYLPRGYNGATWERMDHSISNVDEIMAANRKSMRDEAIRDIIADSKKESKEQTIIIAGDFNEPSHLDWTKATQNMFDHNGAIVPWDCSVMLQEAKFIDAFRKQYPNPVSHPGFTFPAYNKDAEFKKLTWAPLADDRDRIDYIYYKPAKQVKLKDIKIVGPVETIRYGKIAPKDSKDVFLTPKSIWPTDHKGLLAIFSWR